MPEKKERPKLFPVQLTYEASTIEMEKVLKGLQELQMTFNRYVTLISFTDERWQADHSDASSDLDRKHAAMVRNVAVRYGSIHEIMRYLQKVGEKLEKQKQSFLSQKYFTPAQRTWVDRVYALSGLTHSVFSSPVVENEVYALSIRGISPLPPEQQETLNILYAQHRYIHALLTDQLTKQRTELYPSRIMVENYQMLQRLFAVTDAHSKERGRRHSTERMSVKTLREVIQIFTQLLRAALDHPDTAFNQTILDMLRTISIRAVTSQSSMRFSLSGIGKVATEYAMQEEGEKFVEFVQDFWVQLATTLDAGTEIDEKFGELIALSRLENSDGRPERTPFEQNIAMTLMMLGKHVTGPDIVVLAQSMAQRPGLEDVAAYLRSPETLPLLTFCDEYELARTHLPPREDRAHTNDVLQLAKDEVLQEVGIELGDASDIEDLSIADIARTVLDYQRKYGSIVLQYDYILSQRHSFESRSTVRHRLELLAAPAQAGVVHIFCAINVDGMGDDGDRLLTVLKFALSIDPQRQYIDIITHWNRSDTVDANEIDKNLVVSAIKGALILHLHRRSHEKNQLVPARKREVPGRYHQTKKRRYGSGGNEELDQENIVQEALLELRAKYFPLQLKLTAAGEESIESLSPKLQQSVREFIKTYNESSGLISGVTSGKIKTREGEFRLAHLPNGLHDYRMVYTREGVLGNVIGVWHRSEVYD